MKPAVLAVAGCLFEVHLGGRSDWADDGRGAVTLVASTGGQRFRFRAERAGSATLWFGDGTRVEVRIAPEEWAD